MLVRVHRRGVEITVTDDGRSLGQQRGEPGRGLVGMQERVAGLGGRFQAGPGPGGGFRVHVSLPLQEVRP